MIRVVIRNVTPSVPHRFIFICQQQHIESYNLLKNLSIWAPGCKVIGINGLTDGAAVTVMSAADLIDNDSPLMIANSDQYVDCNIDTYLHTMNIARLDGLIMTMKAKNPKWSFVGLEDNHLVNRVAEKEVISHEATVGIYNFSKGSDFVRGCRAMISKNERINGEFYVAPVYNGLIADGQRIGIHNVGAEAAGMYGLGTPADLALFLSLPVHIKATAGFA